MSRKLCVVVRTVEGASKDDVARVERALSTHHPPLDAQRDGGVFYVFYGRGRGVARARKVVAAALHAGGVENRVNRPFPVARWTRARRGYVLPGHTAVLQLSPETVTWSVEIRPASPFVWRGLRAQLAKRGRQTLRETDREISVGASDELDARALAEELAALSTVASAEPRKLGWYRRWLLREALYGNYAGPGDPTSPTGGFF